MIPWIQFYEGYVPVFGGEVSFAFLPGAGVLVAESAAGLFFPDSGYRQQSTS